MFGLKILNKKKYNNLKLKNEELEAEYEELKSEIEELYAKNKNMREMLICRNKEVEKLKATVRTRDSRGRYTKNVK